MVFSKRFLLFCKKVSKKTLLYTLSLLRRDKVYLNLPAEGGQHCTNICFVLINGIIYKCLLRLKISQFIDYTLGDMYRFISYDSYHNIFLILLYPPFSRLYEEVIGLLVVVR